MIHDSFSSTMPQFRFFNDSTIRKVTEMEVEAFKQSLDAFINDANINSLEYLKIRPRFIHAVAVLADPLKSGEIMKASCIKQLDPYHVVIEGGHNRNIEIRKVEGFDELIQTPINQQKQSNTTTFSATQQQQHQQIASTASQKQQQQQQQQEDAAATRRKDSEIEAALKILQESRDLLEDTALSIRFPSEIRARRTSSREGSKQ